MLRLMLTLCVLALFAFCTGAQVVLVENGEARCAIHVSAEIMAENIALASTVPAIERQAETHRQRLRESVRDLAVYLERMSGAPIAIIEGPPEAGSAHLPLLIGELAEARFGATGQRSFFKQGWRLVVSPRGLGFMGESDESASYAIYELLDRLDCRWFIPGEMGEVVPEMGTVSVAEVDVSALPSTPNRRIWYASADYMRRNRLGGFVVSAGHALDTYIAKDKLAANPELNAEQSGKRNIDSGFLCWGNPATAEAVAESIIARLDKQYVPSVSLSPKDGVAFCECEVYCKPLDAGDYDPTMDTISITDRYIVFCNRIVERVVAKYPDVQFGFLAYVQYTRPPVREIPHPNLVPEIAPITYCRAHAMTADNCPSRAILKPIVEGWRKVTKRFAYYNYMFHLAEVAVPYPMIRQMSDELPVIYGGPAEVFWQPETMTNFESVLPGMWLTIRTAWNNSLKAEEVLDDFFTRFHGAAGEPMRRYWQVIDDAWNDVPEHAGCSWGYAARFTPEVMQAARAAMDEAIAAAATPMEYRRVRLFDDSLRQFELFMKMRWDLAGGTVGMLHVQALSWMGTQIGLGDRYAENYAFGKVGWSSVGNIGAGYFAAFNQATYEDIGERIGRGGKFVLVNRTPVREWRYQMIQLPQKEAATGVATGEANGWHAADFADAEWPTTDVAVDTWSTLGQLGKYGTMWYRATVKVPAIPDGKRVYLWMAATDGSVKLFVNGQHVSYVQADGTAVDAVTGYAKPFSFDVTELLKAGDNQLSIAGSRLFINELGTGGLLGPIYLYRDR